MARYELQQKNSKGENIGLFIDNSVHEIFRRKVPDQNVSMIYNKILKETFLKIDFRIVTRMFPRILIRYGASIAWEAIWLTRNRKSAVENPRWGECYRLWCLDEWFVFDNPREDTLVHLLFLTPPCNVCSKLTYLSTVLPKSNRGFRTGMFKTPVFGDLIS